MKIRMLLNNLDMIIIGVCYCGCGGCVNFYRGSPSKFIRGHNWKGHTHSIETLNKMSLVHKGIPKSEEHKRKIGDGNKNKHPSEKTLLKMSEFRMGKHYSPLTEFKEGIHYSSTTEFKKGQRKGILPKNMGRGKRIYYESKLNGKLCFRSGYELAYAKYLDDNNISWCYEAKQFDLGDTTYTPDFYLLDRDEYIEIKGYMYEYAAKKIKLFRETFPKITLKLLYKNDLKKLGCEIK